MAVFVIWCAMFVAPFVAWFFFRSGGYKRQPLDAAPGPGWVKTEESFVDPTSGETLAVWFHPASGERAYVRTRPAGYTT